MNSIRIPLIKDVAEKLPPSDTEKTVLDVGCGGGYVLATCVDT